MSEQGGVITDNKYIIFCDFDGSITKQETLEAFMALNIDDLGEITRELMKKNITLKEGVRQLMSMIPTERYKSNLDFFDNLEIREGFDEFISLIQSQGIPLVVISGGIRQMVEKTLQLYMDKIEAIYAADVNLSGEYVYFYSDYESDDEIVSKIDIMKMYDCETSICIGDSYTDMIMGKNSDIVFARDRLAKVLESDGINYYPYETFYDIIETLEKILNESNAN